MKPSNLVWSSGTAVLIVEMNGQRGIARGFQRNKRALCGPVGFTPGAIILAARLPSVSPTGPRLCVKCEMFWRKLRCMSCRFTERAHVARDYCTE